MNNYKWKIGDVYFVNLWSSGERIYGTITNITEDRYTVNWEDGKTSIEKEIRPAGSYWDDGCPIRLKNERA